MTVNTQHRDNYFGVHTKDDGKIDIGQSRALPFRLPCKPEVALQLAAWLVAVASTEEELAALSVGETRLARMIAALPRVEKEMAR